MPNCSVIQGGKMSGTLYTLYTNEVPLVHKLIENKIYKNKNKIINYKKVSHETINFIDDSTSIISFKETNIIKEYLTEYYNLLETFYNANKLKINPDKSKFLIVCKNKFKLVLKNFSFKASSYVIKPSNTMKILGVYLHSDLKLDSQINKLCSNLHNKIYQLKQINKFTTFKTRLCFIKSYVVGKLVYAMPIYMNSSVKNIASLHKVLMTAARAAIGNYCYRKSTVYILKKCGLLNIKKLIIFSSLSFYYNLNKRKLPDSIYNLFQKQNSRAKTDVFRPIYKPKTKGVDNGCLYRGAIQYNSLPDSMKTLTREKYISTLKDYLAERDLWDTGD